LTEYVTASILRGLKNPLELAVLFLDAVMDLKGVHPHPTLLVLQNFANGNVGSDLNLVYRPLFCGGWGVILKCCQQTGLCSVG
jgi:hypothetical protein